MPDLRYPIGQYKPVSEVSEDARRELIREVELQPAVMRTIVQPLTPEQLATPYRPDGWAVRQVVHHLADNNMNAYVRFKRGLTEDTPAAPPYREDLWAELPDYREIPVEESLTLLDVLHRRFAVLLKAMDVQDFGRTVMHSILGRIRLDAALHRFVWHNRHHIAQITRLCERNGWQRPVAARDGMKHSERDRAEGI